MGRSYGRSLILRGREMTLMVFNANYIDKFINNEIQFSIVLYGNQLITKTLYIITEIFSMTVENR